ncbi:MAG: hypothetical protein KBA26_04970 [Candidatus Delongbacteria bacterium]|nr:hypothetical protein [Candidatus Delongbacteria bacterium]
MKRFVKTLIGCLMILGLIMMMECGKGGDSKSGDNTQNADNTSDQTVESDEASSEESVDNPEDLAEAMKKMGEALKGDGKGVEPVDFRQLKALLPDKIAGLNRGDASGEKVAAFGINVSNAEGSYSSEDGNSSLTIKITDMGSLKGITALAGQAWLVSEIDRETDSGYEKSTTINGHKAFEEYNNDSKSGQISIMIAERFIIEINGDNVEMNAIKSAASALDLNKLASLK